MKKNFVLFSNAEAFIRFQYICTKIRTSQKSSNIILADFLGKEFIAVLLKGNQATLTLRQLLFQTKDCDEFLVINFKNKSSIDTDYLEFFEQIEKKDYTYLENKIVSVNQDRIKLAIESLVKDISSPVAKKNLAHEIKIARQKKDILDYLTAVLEYREDKEATNSIIFDSLLILYYLNTTENFTVKKVFFAQAETLEDYFNKYNFALHRLKNLYQGAIIAYPFSEESEVIKPNSVLQDEKPLIAYLAEESQRIKIHEKNSISIWDIAWVYHIENEESEYDNFEKAIKYCREKNILNFNEGRLYMTKNGERIYSSLLDKSLDKYIIKGF